MLNPLSNPQTLTSSTWFGWLQNTNRSANALTTCVLTSDAWGIANTVPSTGNVTHNGVITTYVLNANTISAIGGTLTITNTALVLDAGSSLTSVGPTSFANTLTVNGGVTFNTTLTVNGVVSFQANTSVADVLRTDVVGRTVTVGSNTASANLIVNGTAWASGDIKGFQTSDKRLKESVEYMSGADALGFVDSVKGATFVWKDNARELSKYVGIDKVGPDVGVIAQDIDQTKYPHIVQERLDGFLSVDYVRIIPYLLTAIRELSNRVDALTLDVANLQPDVKER